MVSCAEPAGRRVIRQEAAVGFDSLHVVQVEEAAAGASEVSFFWPAASNGRPAWPEALLPEKSKA